ncbi:MAG: Nif3-like dinuclear metal center hexameric protein [Bacteroidales bacterium]|nr:Nif3-like dinuclear metal center hexameric protein [Bacteroidales bacterium]
MYLKIKQIAEAIERVAPRVYAEDWDNVGLLVGDPEKEVDQALIALDCSEAVIDEAIEKKAGIIITHHPLIFSAMKKLTPSNDTARLVMKAIKNDIAIYAAHTNLDNISCGLNALVADELELVQRSVLVPQNHRLYKLVTYVPLTHFEQVKEKLFAAGGGCVGHYDSCSFSSSGIGTFRAQEGTHPFVGQIGVLHQESEVRIEMLVAAHQRHLLLSVLKQVHPYEEPAIDLLPLENQYEGAGSGLIGMLKTPMQACDFLQLVKKRMQIPVLRHSSITEKIIQKVAICTGAGSFLMDDAIRCGADAFVTGDVKYHEFFVPQKSLLLIDAGHYETEQFSRQYLYTILKENFTTFAAQISESSFNAVHYLI